MDSYTRNRSRLSTAVASTQDALANAHFAHDAACRSGNEALAGRIKTAILALESADEELYAAQKLLDDKQA